MLRTLFCIASSLWVPENCLLRSCTVVLSRHYLNFLRSVVPTLEPASPELWAPAVMLLTGRLVWARHLS